MIFIKYQTKNKIYCKTTKNLVTKFFQKPVRNINIFLSTVSVTNNTSLLENKINYDSSSFNHNNLNFTVLLNKKIII